MATKVLDDLIKKALHRADVALCVCTHRTVDIDVLSGCMRMFANKKHHYEWMPVVGDADISRSRSRAASYFLSNTSADCLFFIDDDVIFKEEDVTKIVNHVVDGKLICGGMYVKKGTAEKTLVLEEGDSITFSKDAAVKKVVAISTGFMCIHRSVFKSLIAAGVPLCNEGASWQFYPFFDSRPWKSPNGKWIHLSEDWDLCVKAMEMAKISTWVDPSIFLGHKGEAIYDLRDRLRPQKMSWEDFTSITLK